MPLTVLVPGNILQVKFFAYMDPQLGINVVHYKVLSTIGSPTSATVAENLETIQVAAYPPLMANAAATDGVSCQNLSVLPLEEPQLSIAVPTGGSVVGAPMPGQVSGIITKRTGLTGRANRGRMYIPFPGQGDSTSSSEPQPSPSYVTRLNALISLLFGAPIVISTGGDGCTIQPGIYHRATGTFTNGAGGTARSKWATQRRRGDYGRPNVPN